MKEKEENFQKLYIEFQMLSSTIKQLEKQNEVLEQQLLELLTTRQSLEDIKKVKQGAEILVPVSAGIYLKAELKETNNFIVNVGSNVALSKNLESTKQVIDDQIGELREMQENIAAEFENSTAKASKIEEELKQIASTLQEE